MAKGAKESAIIAGFGIGALICLGVTLTLLAVLANVGMLGFLVNEENKGCPDCICGVLLLWEKELIKIILK
jgi:hypothetical protein